MSVKDNVCELNGEPLSSQYDLSGTPREPIERSQNLTAKRSARTNMCPMMDNRQQAAL